MTLSRIYGFRKYVTNLECQETQRYLEMFFRLQSRSLAEAVPRFGGRIPAAVIRRAWTTVGNTGILRPPAPVAQLDRVPPSEGDGQRFESSRARHSLCLCHARSDSRPFGTASRRLARAKRCFAYFTRLALSGAPFTSFILRPFGFPALRCASGVRRTANVLWTFGSDSPSRVRHSLCLCHTRSDSRPFGTASRRSARAKRRFANSVRLTVSGAPLR
ncbi:MAG: hypothetical protein FD165_1512 [Gammaproteobacteria bacterium]|nr:MAG: hypothetical protein FD165_1512 [Gammaproteobacteria bacterium]TND02477.1 MAG: hypothetical protein FD120_2218 [Gammaproteobacteria bacterium]